MKNELILPSVLAALEMAPGTVVNPERWLTDRGWRKTGRTWTHDSCRATSTRDAVGLQLVAEHDAIVAAMGFPLKETA